MINFLDLDNNLKVKKINNFYIFCGFNENIIKEYIKNISLIATNNNFLDLNYFEYDGNKVTYDDIINSCETLPFLSDKKVVVIYRANFFSDKGKAMNKNGDEIIKQLIKYDVPSHCVLMIYYIFENDREKVSSKVRKFDKKALVVEFTKLKGMLLQKKVKEMFKEKGKDIGKAELGFFCSEVENNLDIIENEIEKLCCYCEEKNILREDIIALLPHKSDSDIFNLVDFLSQKKVENALEILDELMFRGEKATYILSMFERQFRLMINIKFKMEEGKSKEEISAEEKLHPFVCEKLMMQCKKFTALQLAKAEELCLKTELLLKSTGGEDKIKLELLIINSAML